MESRVINGVKVYPYMWLAHIEEVLLCKRV